MNPIFSTINKLSAEVAFSYKGEKETYDEMRGLVSEATRYYSAAGICENENIAILSDNNIDFVVAALALWNLGAIPVPINLRASEEEKRDIAKNADCKAILFHKDYSISNSIYDNLLPLYTTAGKDGKSNSLNEDIPLEKTAVIIHTSGSTGKPKGVEISFANLINSFDALNSFEEFSETEKIVASLPFYHIGGFAVIVRSILCKGSLIIPESQSVTDITKILLNERPTRLSLVPTMLKRLLENKVAPNTELVSAYIGGGPSDSEILMEALNSNWPLVKIYGASETTAMVTAERFACVSHSGFSDNTEGIVENKLETEKTPFGNLPFTNFTTHPDRIASSGKALGKNIIKVIKEDGEEANRNDIGEIIISGGSIAKGYYKDQKNSAAKFRSSFYYSGDFGYMDNDNFLYIISRREDLIVSGGENIDPDEVRNVLVKHNSVSDAVICALPDKEWGQIVCAIIIPANNISQEELTSFMKRNIASYKVPKRIIFTDKLPINEMGKLIRDKLLSLADKDGK